MCGSTILAVRSIYPLSKKKEKMNAAIESYKDHTLWYHLGKNKGNNLAQRLFFKGFQKLLGYFKQKNLLDFLIY